MRAWILAFALCLPSVKAEAAHPVHREIKVLAAELRRESRKTGPRDFAAIEAKAKALEESARALPEGPDRAAAQALLGRFKSLFERAKGGEALEDDGEEGPYIVPPPDPPDPARRRHVDDLEDEARLAEDGSKVEGVFDGRRGGGKAVAVPASERGIERVGRYVRRHRGKDGSPLGHDLELTNLLFRGDPRRGAWAAEAAGEMVLALGLGDPDGKKMKLLAAWILRTLDASDRFKPGHVWRLFFTVKGRVHFVHDMSGEELMEPEGVAIEEVWKAPPSDKKPGGGGAKGGGKKGGVPIAKGAKKGGAAGGGGSSGGKKGGRRGGGGGGRGGFGGKASAGGIGGGRGGSGRATRAGSGVGRLAGGRAGRQGFGPDVARSGGGGRSASRPSARKMTPKKPVKPAGGRRGGGPEASRGPGSKAGKGKAGSGAKGAKGERPGGKTGKGGGPGGGPDGRFGGRRLGGKRKGGDAGGKKAAKGAEPEAAAFPAGAAAEPASRADIAFTDAPSAEGHVEDIRDAVSSPVGRAVPAPGAAAEYKPRPLPAAPSLPAVGWGFMVGFAAGVVRLLRMWKWARRGYEALAAIFDTTEAVS